MVKNSLMATKMNIDSIRAALAKISDPATGDDLIQAGRVQGLTVRGGHVGFIIEAARDSVDAYHAVRDAAERVVADVPGVDQVTAVLTAHGAGASSAPPSRPDQGEGHVASGAPSGAPVHALRRSRARLSDAAVAQTAPRSGGQGPDKRLSLPGVRHIIAVASGKGGVGKSTIAANLACGLARMGLNTGLMDADVYGPSVPIVMGVVGADPEIGPDKKLIPPVAHGVKVMSMGFMVDADAPMIWRGPIVMSAITQMLKDVAWQPLDVLVVDMPPGTGDAQLTLVQRVALSGAVIVSTPQELALADVRRGVEMFRRTHTPVIGIVENMSASVDPETGQVFAPFGEGGAKRAAALMDERFLTKIALDPGLAAASDAGTPPGADPDNPLYTNTFSPLAHMVSETLMGVAGRKEPEIFFE